MQWSDIPWGPGDRTLRQFGGLLVLSAAAAAWLREELRGPALVAAMVGTTGLLRPGALRPLYVGWMLAVFPVSWLASRLLLALLFYGLVTPVGLLFRLAGRDALRRRRGREESSYWQPRGEGTDSLRYFRQF